ncbi:MAG TPA: DNA repair protein RecO [Pantanalinema sp.]
MSTYTATGITLRHYPTGEYDKILVVFTREHGLKRVIAKGARRKQSKLGGKTEPLVRAEWFLGKGKNLDVVAQCEGLHAHRALREDLDRLLSGMYLAELVEALVEDEQPHPEVFDLLASTLMVLEVAASPPLVVAWFELTLLHALGYGLELDACVLCSDALDHEGCGFSAEEGGALCAACRAVRGQRRLHHKGLSLLRRLSAVELSAIAAHSLGPDLLAHARGVLQASLALHAGRPLKTLDLLAKS